MLALSDGAGSSRYAREAASAVTGAVTALFEQMSPRDFSLLPRGRRVQVLLEACAARTDPLSQRSPTDACATLLFFADDGEATVFGHLGDGYLLALDAKGGVLWESLPDNTGNDHGRTVFTVSPDAAARLRICTARGDGRPAQVLLMSDGPCAMFRSRGGTLTTTAAELLGYAAGGQLTSNEDLAAALDQMTLLPSERSDDWSIAIWCQNGTDGTLPAVQECSMLARELEKYAINTEETR